MKVLLVNTFHYLRGGDCRYTFALAALLRKNGHSVAFFAMRHPRNIRCAEEKYFVDYIDFPEMLASRGVSSALKVLRRSVYSLEARRRLGRLLDKVQPDVAHLQNIHAHITPSIIPEFAKRGIPVFWTLHDYKLICPNTHLLSHGDICEACRGGRFYQCTVRRCKKGSRAASAVASLEAYVHRALRVTENVKQFVSPSDFLAEKFVQFGWNGERIASIRNFLPDELLDRGQGPSDGGYGVYLGQLEPWKGVKTLVEAMSRVKHGVQLRILGEGTQREACEEVARQLPKGVVRFEGYLSGDELVRVVSGAAFVVVPSEWYENCPYSVMEAMALGKPVVASSIGGLPELVSDGENGLLVKPGDAAELAAAMDALWSDRTMRTEMGRRGRERAREEFAAQRHYLRLRALYESGRTKA